MFTPISLKARQILDSRGMPTVEVDLALKSGAFGRAAVPSGASVGSKEALELRDGGSTFHGKGVTRALKNIEQMQHKIINKSFESQKTLDNLLCELDGTPNKSNMGANAILAISLAFAKASAAQMKLPLYKYIGEGRTMPVPLLNVINGGAHADNALDIQEFMIVPHGFDVFADRIRAGSEIFHTLKKLLHSKGMSTNVGDEGGFAPNLQSSRVALDLLLSAIEKSGYKVGEQVSLALDVAASEFFEDGVYNMKGENLKMDSHGLCHYFEELCKHYPIASIEDPMHESDYAGWTEITNLLGRTIQIVGDDVFVTNPALIQDGIDKGIANAVLIKPNQIGSLTETLEAINLSQKAGYKTILSHRSGETEDTMIAHIAVGVASGQIKSGSVSRTDRLCKYNELLRIEESLAG